MVMNRLLVSFSGGRTSGYMTWRILQEWKDKYDDIVVLFANTGLEHEKTLEFVRNCDEHFGFNTVWLEAVVNPEWGKGTKHKIVDYDSASRQGQPFEDVVSVYGIPNVDNPICTRELKLGPMKSYVRGVGWKAGTYDQVVGIRADEIDRMSPSADKFRILYPLVGWCVTKQSVRDWWSTQVFDLGIRELEGNCVTCLKKSDRKLLTLAAENPQAFDFFAKLEDKYPMVGQAAKRHGVAQVFFRRYRSAKDILASSREPFTPWTPTTADQQVGLFSLDEMDISNGCTESCEVEYI